MTYGDWEEKQQERGWMFGPFFHEFVTGEGWLRCNYCQWPRRFDPEGKIYVYG